jgi:hypothetical protein
MDILYYSTTDVNLEKIIIHGHFTGNLMCTTNLVRAIEIAKYRAKQANEDATIKGHPRHYEPRIVIIPNSQKYDPEVLPDEIYTINASRHRLSENDVTIKKDFSSE